jgi:hypothetical protein
MKPVRKMCECPLFSLVFAGCLFLGEDFIVEMDRVMLATECRLLSSDVVVVDWLTVTRPNGGGWTQNYLNHDRQINGNCFCVNKNL